MGCMPHCMSVLAELLFSPPPQNLVGIQVVGTIFFPSKKWFHHIWEGGFINHPLQFLRTAKLLCLFL